MVNEAYIIKCKKDTLVAMAMSSTKATTAEKRLKELTANLVPLTVILEGLERHSLNNNKQLVRFFPDGLEFVSSDSLSKINKTAKAHLYCKKRNMSFVYDVEIINLG